jgi:hypothetical protein
MVTASSLESLTTFSSTWTSMPFRQCYSPPLHLTGGNGTSLILDLLLLFLMPFQTCISTVCCQPSSRLQVSKAIVTCNSTTPAPRMLIKPDLCEPRDSCIYCPGIAIEPPTGCGIGCNVDEPLSGLLSHMILLQ